MNGQSLDITAEKVQQLKVLFPEAFTEDKIDWEKLKATLGGYIYFNNERYLLNWAGKGDAFKTLQVPTSKTLIPAKEEGINFDDTQHIFIEGENLETLKVLQYSYNNKVKMIYIDPPYNTGNDSFVYPDKFSEDKADYDRRVGEVSENGNKNKEDMLRKNTKENGHYHSNWLNMMMPRLFLAKHLLREDGVIFVSIDDNEVHNLRLLMNEVFGEENFVGNIVWNSTKSVINTALLSVSHTYNLVYFKNLNYFTQNRKEFRLPEDGNGFSNPDNDPRGLWKADPFQVGGWRPNQQYEIVNPKTKEIYKPNVGNSWKNDLKKYKELVNDNRIVFGVNGEVGPQRKRFLNEALEKGKVSKTWWDNIGTTTNGTQTLKKLFPESGFNNPKPVDLIQKMIQLGDYFKDGIILDFFAGSGTTAQAVMELNKEDGGNRKYICVQLAEECDKESEAYKAGYKTIAEISKERIRRAARKVQEEITEEIAAANFRIAKLQAELNVEEVQEEIERSENRIAELQTQDLGFKVLKLHDSNFEQWRQLKEYTAENLTRQIQLSIDNIMPTSTVQGMVYELLLKNGLDLNSRIEKQGEIYNINEGELVLLLTEVTEAVIDKVIALAPQKVIALDKIFEGDDQLKTNTVLQMNDEGIKFRTI